MVRPGYKWQENYGLLEPPIIDIEKSFSSIDEDETEEELLFQQNKPIVDLGAPSLYAERNKVSQCMDTIIILVVTFTLIFGLFFMRYKLFKDE